MTITNVLQSNMAAAVNGRPFAAAVYLGELSHAALDVSKFHSMKACFTTQH